MQSQNPFEKHFDYGSFIPIIIFTLGFYILYLLINNKFSLGFLFMLISFILYIINNAIINYTGFTTVFNEYLEDMASFLAFGITTIVFGLIFYGKELYILIIVFFYAICILLALARNWILRLKNSVGFPIALNGLFFPSIYYIYFTYLQAPGNAIFIIYFFIIAILSISHINFLGYKESQERIKVIDKNLIQIQKKDKDLGLDFLDQ